MKGEWTAHGSISRIGVQTERALGDLDRMLERGDTDSLALLHLEADEETNDNGSLMRILPLYFLLRHERMEERFETIREVIALTHPHVRSALASLMYLIMIQELEDVDVLRIAYLRTALRMREFLDQQYTEERTYFARLIDNDIRLLHCTRLRSGTCVVETLESSFGAS